MPLTQSDQVLVNFVEVWERNKAGKVIYHNAWVTDFAMRPENVPTIVGIGRSRWKIENEQFNVQKNHGYELEHNYEHGERGLSLVLNLLNLLAFLAHQVLEMGDRLYRACRANGSRRYLWQHLRVYFQKLPFIRASGAKRRSSNESVPLELAAHRKWEKSVATRERDFLACLTILSREQQYN